MTTLRAMYEKMFWKNMRAHFIRNYNKPTRKDKNLKIEALPTKTIARTYTLYDTKTNEIQGYDIVFNSSYNHRFHPANLWLFKEILMHELAHCRRGGYGHRMDFRRCARRIRCSRNFVSSGVIFVHKICGDLK